MESQTFSTRREPVGDLEKALSTLGTGKLNRFRELVGITDVVRPGPRAARRPAPNIGIYRRASSEEQRARLQYYACASTINVCLLSQVIFASALTALGAGHGSHIQITALGAANTVIAAILTFTKGSGLPNRLRQYQHTLRKVREYIEQKERDFAQVNCTLNVETEMTKIRQMYEEARQVGENNDPSSYHNSIAAPAQGKPMPHEPIAEQPAPSIRRSALPVAISPRPLRSSSEGHQTADKSEDEHTEPSHLPPKPEDSERWKIAYSVANRLVSSKHPW